MGVFRLPDGATYETGDNAEKSYWDGETVKGVVIKSDDERRYTLTVAYPADSPDVAKARDGYMDFASADAVEKAAWAFMANGGEIGAWHADGTGGTGRLVESYVYRGPDWKIEAADGSNQVIKSGDWLIGTIWTTDAWQAIKSGEATGVSMQGGAQRKVPSPAEIARVVAARNARG